MPTIAVTQDSISTDDDLLRSYVVHGDRNALAMLVERYAPMVYGAACRQMNDPHLADDVMQNVFVTLARRCGSIHSGAALGVWLLQTTRYTALNTMKTQARRHRHETAAARPEASPQNSPVEVAIDAEQQRSLETIGPWLDQSISRLRKPDQTAIVLRFFRGQSLRQIALAMGTGEDAARKRVSRAISRLRKHLIASGAPPVACAESALTAYLSGPALLPVPAPLVAHITATASVTKLAGVSVFQGVLTMTTAAKVVTGAVVATVIFGGGVSLVRWAGVKFTDDSATVALHAAAVPGMPAPLPAAIAPNPTATPADWNARFDAAYTLAPGEAVKFVAEPFIPEREQFLKQNSRTRRPRASSAVRQFGGMPLANWSNSIVVPGGAHGMVIRPTGGLPPAGIQNSVIMNDGAHAVTGVAGAGAPQAPAGVAIEQQHDGSFRLLESSYGDVPPLSALLKSVPILQDAVIEGDPMLLQQGMEGDWVVRAFASPQALFDGFARAISTHLGRKVTFASSIALRDMIVVSGISRVGQTGQPQMSVESKMGPDGQRLHLELTGRVAQLVFQLRRLTGLPCIDQTSPGALTSCVLDVHIAAQTMTKIETADLLRTLTAQTGLGFNREQRMIQVWTLHAQ
jgi:RNA polymerase sigma factor (sigma-70 family)